MQTLRHAQQISTLQPSSSMYSFMCVPFQWSTCSIVALLLVAENCKSYRFPLLFCPYFTSTKSTSTNFTLCKIKLTKSWAPSKLRKRTTFLPTMEYWGLYRYKHRQMLDWVEFERIGMQIFPKIIQKTYFYSFIYLRFSWIHSVFVKIK